MLRASWAMGLVLSVPILLVTSAAGLEVAPEVPAIEKVVVFLPPEGGIVVQYLGSLDAQYEVERGQDRVTLRVVASDGNGYSRVAVMFISPETPYFEAYIPRRAVEAPSPLTDNHTGTCHSEGWCSDLHRVGVCCGADQTWHGMQVHSYAPESVDPSTVYYKYACDTGWSCTIFLEEYWHPAGVSYGSLHCYRHTKPPNVNSYQVWSKTIKGGSGVESWKATFTTNTGSC